MNLTDLYFKDLFENTSDLIQYVSLEGETEMVNPAWLHNLGYSLEEVKGRSIYEFIDPTEINTYKTYREACMNHQNRDDLEITFMAKGMIPVIVEGHLRPFFHENKFLHTRRVFRNNTLKKEKEKTGEGPVLNKTIEVPAIDKYNSEFLISLNISSVKL